MGSRIRRCVVAIAIVTAGGLGLAEPAYAATITVTTTADEVVADGVVSLREAITEANVAGGATTIDLAANETYTLDECAGDEDANVSGDLDYVASDPLTINGNGSTVEQTCDGQRILQQSDTSAAVTLNDMTLTGGEGGGAAVSYAGDVVLNAVTVEENDAGPGAVLDSEPMLTGASLVLDGTTVGPNVGTGIRISFGAVTITDSSVSNNSLRGVGLIDGSLSIAGSLFELNGGDGVFTSGQGTGLLTFANSVSRDNGGTGVICSHCGDLDMTGSMVNGNENGGVQVAVDQDPPGDITVNVETTSVFDNTKAGPGAALAITITELSDDAPVAQILVNRSTLSNNTASGGTGRGGGVYAATGDVRVNNSTIVHNDAAVDGGGVVTLTGDVHLQHATIAENTAPVGANIASGADLHAFGSIVAAGAGAGDDCEVTGSTTSTGYNLGGDASCAFAAAGDTNNVGDPGLGPLQDNGGPTLTRAPLAGSAALGQVPVGACTVLTIDQRGIARPQGANCESGAVEVALDGDGLAGTGTSVTWYVVAGLLLLMVGAGAVLVGRRRG
jgi:CSLREA domain-containing protein/LPXTG-motif cell wall-anchored protein